jgi:hypothetical protein
MEFQQFFDPFGTMLKAQGEQLQNEGKSVENQTNLVRLQQAKEQLDLTKQSNKEIAEAFAASQGLSGGNVDTGAAPTTPTALYQNGKAKEGITPSDEIATSIKNYDSQIALQKKIAMSRAKANDYKGAQEALTQMDTLLKDRLGPVKEQQALDLKRTDDLANMFEEMAKGPSQAGGALSAMMYKHPEFDPSTLESKFGFKMMNGYPVYDKDRAISLAHAMRQGKDQMEVAHHEAEEDDARKRRDISQKSNELRERELNIQAARLRDAEQLSGLKELPKDSPLAKRQAEQTAGDKTLTGQAYLDSLPTGRKEMIKSIADGNTKLETLSNRVIGKGPNATSEREQALEQVLRYKPDYDQSKYAIYQAVKKDFAGEGVAGKNITFIGTAVGHMGTLKELSDAMKNNDTQLINHIVNATATQLGDPRINNVSVAASALGSEMMKIFRQVGASEKEQKDWADKYGTMSSPAQMEGALETSAHLMSSRVNELDWQWQRGMDTKEHYPKMFSPQAIEVLNKLGVKNAWTEKEKPTSKDKDTPMSLEEARKKYGLIPAGGG